MGNSKLEDVESPGRLIGRLESHEGEQALRRLRLFTFHRDFASVRRGFQLSVSKRDTEARVA